MHNVIISAFSLFYFLLFVYQNPNLILKQVISFLVLFLPVLLLFKYPKIYFIVGIAFNLIVELYIRLVGRYSNNQVFTEYYKLSWLKVLFVRVFFSYLWNVLVFAILTTKNDIQSKPTT
jgi:hypothetical protein